VRSSHSFSNLAALLSNTNAATTVEGVKLDRPRNDYLGC
jgi:hypothetical protein